MIIGEELVKFDSILEEIVRFLSYKIGDFFVISFKTISDIISEIISDIIPVSMVT